MTNQSPDLAPLSFEPTVQAVTTGLGSPTKPRLLDLFCCEGGAAVGYARAGFDVVGVDLLPKYRKRYPFKFYASNAVRLLDSDNHGWLRLKFDAVHASPPCQHASAGTRAAKDRGRYPRLIEPVRERLEALGLPYVIENVSGSALRDPLVLCGTMFGLTAIDDDGERVEMWRHRHFESNVPLLAKWSTPYGGCAHGRYSKQVAGSYGGARRDKAEAREVRHGGYVPSKAVQERLLGIDWMTQYGLYQSVPPAYTEYVGEQLRAHLDAQKEAA